MIPPTRPLRRALAPAAACVLLLSLSGCSRAVAVEAAPRGYDPLCSQVYTALPEGVAGLDRRETTAQGAAAWSGGTDAEVVVLRCGVAPLEAIDTAGGCVEIDDSAGTTIDWIPGEPRDGRVTWTTYGRSPAVALEMPAVDAVTTSAPQDVGPAVALVPEDRACS